ncbi:MAG: DUF2325 domain-containing protein [Chloroflexota bacterium]
MDGKQRLEQKTRRYYWEINDILCCPVVGTCLTFEEQKRVLKKARIKISSFSDHKIHTTLVQCGKSEGPISHRLQQMLEQKYKDEISEWGYCSESQFFAEWKRRLKKGDIGAFLWIGASNPFLDLHATNRIFGDYHMLMHGQGIIIRRQLQTVESLQRNLNDLKQERQKLSQTLSITKSDLRKARRDFQSLEMDYQKQKAENIRLRQLPEQKVLQSENESLKKQLQLLEGRLCDKDEKIDLQSEQLAQVHNENETLTQSLSDQNERLDFFRQEFALLSQTYQTPNQGFDACLECPYRVLIIGGMKTLRPYYQQIVESGGGKFKHYDSRDYYSEQQLKALVNWAEVVLCPVDFNSHRACLAIKGLCKKMQKPYQMLRSSSVSSISTALEHAATDLPIQ